MFIRLNIVNNHNDFFEGVIVMPRVARVKLSEAIYHVMSRSISEVDLFRSDKDKNVYLKYVKKYKEIFLFKIYSYCIMSNHVHLLIDSNGADISKFMHCINQSYSQYFNKKYSRHGHLFGDRFKSKIAHSDLSVMCISAYIHNNPKDIKGYRNCVENYKYSSFGIYLGKYKDTNNLIDKDFILKYFNSDPILAVYKYTAFIKSRNGITEDNMNLDLSDLEFNASSYEYRNYKSDLVGGISPENIITLVSKAYGFRKSDLHIKYNHNSSKFRAICIVLIRSLCDLKFSDICNFLGNTTLSSVSYLCNKGYSIINTDPNYHLIIDNIINQHKLEKSNNQ